jgi:ABC-type transport system involved in multi-copper enzyme maturation permease subunit
MKDLIRAEFLKIRTTRTVYGLFAAMLALIALGVFTTKRSLIDEGIDPTPLVNQESLFLAGSVAWLFVLVMALRSFTDEFRHGSIVPTLLANPDRRRVLLAKVVAVAVTSLVFVVGAYAVALAIGVPRLGPGADTNVASAAMAALLGKAALTSILWAALGVGLGLAVRHQVAAIAGSFVWIMFIESVLEGSAQDVAKYLPRNAWIAVVGPPNATGIMLDPLPGGLVLAAWTAAVVLAGVVLMRRRDVA